jgi:signal transduction histidine kinase
LQHPNGQVSFAEELPELHADRAQIGMLFDNLIANGLKFNQSAEPTVQVLVEDDLLDWRIIVRDNGIGIDPAHREEIFDLFRRLHRHSDYPGTGTGLTLARRVVEDHRGTITVEDAPDEGTQVVFTLPKRPQLLTLPGVRPPS